MGMNVRFQSLFRYIIYGESACIMSHLGKHYLVLIEYLYSFSTKTCTSIVFLYKNSVTKVFVYGVTHLFILEHSDKPKAFKWTNKK